MRNRPGADSLNNQELLNHADTDMVLWSDWAATQEW